MAVKGFVALLGTGVVLLSLVFTIQPAWHLLEKGHGEGALLWGVWGLFWSAFWLQKMTGLYAKVGQQERQRQPATSSEITAIPTLPPSDPRLAGQRGVVVKGSVAVNCTRCNALQNIRLGASSFTCRECKAVIPIVMQE